MSSDGAQTVDNLLAEVCAELHEQAVPNHLTSISRQLLEVVRVRSRLWGRTAGRRRGGVARS